MTHTIDIPNPAADAVSPIKPNRRNSGLSQVVAWVGIVAGTVFIVGSVFFTGFILGSHGGHGSGGGHHHGRSHSAPLKGRTDGGPRSQSPQKLTPPSATTTPSTP